MMMGNAKQYVRKIYEDFDKAGYYCQHFMLNASTMGVPQKRIRIFFVCLRKDLSNQFLYMKDMFTEIPEIKMEFKEQPIKYGEYRSETGSDEGLTAWTLECLKFMIPSDKCISDINERHFGKISRFNALLIDDDDIYPTITATEVNYRKFDKKSCSDHDYCCAGSYPLDYNFNGNKPKYIIGMSVPPVMTAQVATNIYEQWLSKID